eukprot:403374405
MKSTAGMSVPLSVSNQRPHTANLLVGNNQRLNNNNSNNLENHFKYTKDSIDSMPAAFYGSKNITDFIGHQDNSAPQLNQDEHSFELNQKYFTKDDRVSSNTYTSNSLNPTKQIQPLIAHRNASPVLSSTNKGRQNNFQQNTNNFSNAHYQSQNQWANGGSDNNNETGALQIQSDATNYKQKSHQKLSKQQQKQSSNVFVDQNLNSSISHNNYQSSVNTNNNGHNLLQNPKHRSLSNNTQNPLFNNLQHQQQNQEIDLILNQKEQELQQINQLRIQTLENIIEEKMKYIDQLERQANNGSQASHNHMIGQQHNTGSFMNLHGNRTSEVTSGREKQVSDNHLDKYLNHQIEDDTQKNNTQNLQRKLQKYRERGLKYKTLYNQTKNALQVEQMNSNQYQQQYEEQKIKNQELEMRVGQVQQKIEQEIRRVKTECQNLITRQEQEFQQEREKLKEIIETKHQEIENKKTMLNEYKHNHSKTREIQQLREEMISKLQEKNSDMRLLELEIQRLLNENSQVQSQNEELINELEHVRLSSMEHLENMERELQVKYEQAQNGDQQLRELQEQFLMFRDEKKLKENDLKSQAEKYKNEVFQIKRDKDLEIQHIKLVSETERLNLKSEFEVKLEILSKENVFLIEERKRLKGDLKSWQSKYEAEQKLFNQEQNALKNELLSVKRDEASKSLLNDEINNMKAALQACKTQIDKILLDNQSLQRQLLIAKQALNNQIIVPHSNQLESNNLNVSQLTNQNNQQTTNDRSLMFNDVLQTMATQGGPPLTERRTHHSHRTTVAQHELHIFQAAMQLSHDNDMQIPLQMNTGGLNNVQSYSQQTIGNQQQNQMQSQQQQQQNTMDQSFKNQTPREIRNSQMQQKILSNDVTSQNFQKEYFSMKDENMQLKLDNYNLNQQLQQIQIKLQELQQKKNTLSDQLKQKRKEYDEMEKKLNDSIIKLKEKEQILIENHQTIKTLNSDIDSREREMKYMQDKIDKLSDPVTLKFEKDGLVSTYKKRVQEMEEYIKQIESQIAELKAQQFEQKQALVYQENNPMLLNQLPHHQNKPQIQQNSIQTNINHSDNQFRRNLSLSNTKFSNNNPNNQFNEQFRISNNFSGNMESQNYRNVSSFKDKIASMKEQLQL